MISEVDIKDMRELYNLSKGDTFRFAQEDIYVPPDAPEVSIDSLYKFLKLDGMYAQIHPAEGGPMIFAAAWTKVFKEN